MPRTVIDELDAAVNLAAERIRELEDELSACQKERDSLKEDLELSREEVGKLLDELHHAEAELSAKRQAGE